MPKKASEMPFYVSLICFECVHKYDGYRMCKAFDHIPDDIWEAINKHDTPYKGDRGIQFKQRKDGHTSAASPPESLTDDWLGWHSAKNISQ